LVDDQLTLIRDITDLLKNLIQNNITELNNPASVILDSPGDIAAPSTQDQLSLFLYQISENPFLRNQDVIKIGLDKLQSPPLALDLFYLLTPYAKDREAEQIILAKLMRLFHDNAIISGTQLGDPLLESGNTELRVTMNTIGLDQLNLLWGMFPNKSFRIGLSYTVTPLIIPSTRVIDTQRVIKEQIDVFYQNQNTIKQ
jgi:hypothetical protein